FCEDYAGRSSGVPDLIVWNAAKGQCKFVEVKGPGDTASENQKVRFRELIHASINIS
ncbi:VRR-NUC domain-containing protein, partial [Alkalibacillus haloalkaliphilus]|uniref:VRR-NUC domain-containing protein n=1 Tax=Alkalibacillus haloalkaliphilus TaxID=94136 RepID=UPI0034DFDC08